MTLDEFRQVLAALPETIAVSRYVSDKEVFPRIVWNETQFRDTVASNMYDDLTITVVAELITDTTDTTTVYTVIDHLRAAGIVIDAISGYDPDHEWVSTDFSVQLTEGYPG